MVNEIKVRAEIVEKQTQLFKKLGYDKRRTSGILNNACVSMAEWKNKQVRKALDEAFLYVRDHSQGTNVSLKAAYDALLLIGKVVDNED